MKRSDAKKIAETITNDQIKQMFDAAKVGVKDWSVVSNVNKGLSKGIEWNILAKDFDVDQEHHILTKTNMIIEFGEFLPDELKIKKEPKKIFKHVHIDPKF